MPRSSAAAAAVLAVCLLLGACRAAPDSADASSCASLGAGSSAAGTSVPSSDGSSAWASADGSSAPESASSQTDSSRSPASSAPSSSASASSLPQETHTLTGRIEQVSASELTVSANGKSYRFRRGASTAVTGGTLLAGLRAALHYRGPEAAPDSLSEAALESVAMLPPENGDALGAVLAAMPLSDRVGQMFLARCPDSGAADAVGKYQPGGYVLFGRDFSGKTAPQVRSVIGGYQAQVRVPMLIAVDEEGGSVVRISSNKNLRASPFLSPSALYAQGGFDLIASDTREKAQLLKSLGVNVNLAPVCDVSTDANDYIHARTFGQDGAATAVYVKTVVEQMKAQRLGSVLKHFPGYGNNTDTHNDVAHDDRPLERFRTEDFLPFAAGIQAGADGVMVSHNIVACMDPDFPASLSPKVHEILRGELGFDGVIITDDLYMQAIQKYTDNKNAAVLAVKAGNDLLCCTDFQVQIGAVLDAVRAGEISEARVNESVRRILEWKVSIGLIVLPQ